MDGGSKAEVPLTRDGILQYGTIGGGAKLRYRKAEAADPAVILRAGRHTGGGMVAGE